MKTNKNKPSAKQKRVKVGKIGAIRELSNKDAKTVRGGFSFVKRIDKSTPA